MRHNNAITAVFIIIIMTFSIPSPMGFICGEYTAYNKNDGVLPSFLLYQLSERAGIVKGKRIVKAACSIIIVCFYIDFFYTCFSVADHYAK